MLGFRMQKYIHLFFFCSTKFTKYFMRIGNENGKPKLINDYDDNDEIKIAP